MGDLSEKFKNIPAEVLQEILQKFCRMDVSDRHSQQYMRKAPKDVSQSETGGQFKFMKSKDAIKTLSLTIIGLTVHLSTQSKSKGHFLERILKKDGSDLKSFYQELGMNVEQTKRKDRESGADVDDVWVSFSNSIVPVKKQRKEQKTAMDE